MTLQSVNKTILLNMDVTTSSATASINIPFLVSKIVVKQIAIDKTSSYTGLLQDAFLQSDLVQNNMLGIINMSATIYQPIPNLVYEYTNPVAIRGDYKFTLLGNTLAIFPLAVSVHYVGIIIEFIK